jgi:hypothetical protein
MHGGLTRAVGPLLLGLPGSLPVGLATSMLL